MLAELVYNGRTLEEIADLDDYQLNYIFARKRDECGRLVRRDPDLPWWVETDHEGMRIVSNPVPFSQMFVQVKENRGMTREQSMRAWSDYRKGIKKLEQ